MSENMDLIRSGIRKDLDSISMIPTGMGVQLASEGKAHVAYALYVESVYVRLFNGRDFDEIVDYLKTRMSLPHDMADRILFTAVHVRDVLAGNGGDAWKAQAVLMQERNADQEVIAAVIEAAIRVSGEYKVGWQRRFESAYIQWHNEGVAKARKAAFGCLAVVVVVVAGIAWLIFRMLR